MSGDPGGPQTPRPDTRQFTMARISISQSLAEAV
jgi:hypothetical protein